MNRLNIAYMTGEYPRATDTFIQREVAALIAEEAFEELDGPIMRLAAADTHIPYAPSLEEAILPNADDVAQAIRRLAAY